MTSPEQNNSEVQNGKDQQELLRLSQKLLDSIASGDWETYANLCDPSLTCFEPEACGQLVHGMEFHKFYFDNLSYRSKVNTTITAEHVRMIGGDVAVVCYVRLAQKMNASAVAETLRPLKKPAYGKNKMAIGNMSISTEAQASKPLS